MPGAPDLFAPPTPAELKGASDPLFAPPTSEELKAQSAPSGKSRTLADLNAEMDQNARDMGYKDINDQSDVIGRGVMGGQIAGLAGPAMSAISKVFGRGAAELTPEAATAGAEAAAPAVESATPQAGNAFRVSNAGPIKNLPRPGSPLFESSPVEPAAAAPAAVQEAPGVGKAAMDAMKGGLKNQSQAVDAQKIQDAVLHLAEKHPTVGAALGIGGVGGALHEAMKHPELAAALAVLGVGGPLTTAASGFLGGQIGREEAVKRAIKSRRSQRQ